MSAKMPSDDSLDSANVSLSQMLPADCIRLIVERCVEYEEEGPVDLCPLIRLRLVCRTFDIEVMHLICLTGLFWKMKRGRSLTQLRQAAIERERKSKQCVASLKGNAAAFLARYMVMQPRDRAAAWNATMFTVINAVVDNIMSEDGLEVDAPERYNYLFEICQNALPITQGHQSRDFGMWDLFSPRGFSLIFPTRATITEASFETHVILAQIYLKRPDTVTKLRSLLLDKGPRPLSTFNEKHKRDKPLFGCFLEAAIRTRNLDLISFLLRNDIDMTPSRKKVKGGEVKKARKPFYDGHFLHLAIYSGESDAIEILVQRRIRQRADITSLILSAVCSGYADISRELIEHCFPQEEGEEEGLRKIDWVGKLGVIESALREACHHKDGAVVEAILSCRQPTTAPNFIKKGDMKQPFRVFTHSTPVNWSYHAKSFAPIKICIDNRDLASMKLLLDNGSDPHRDQTYWYGNSHMFVIETEEKGPMPIILPLLMCHYRDHLNGADPLLDPRFHGTTREWLVVAAMLSCKPRIVGANVQRDEWDHHYDKGREIKWQELWKSFARLGVFEMADLLSECDRIKATQGETGSGTPVIDADKVKGFLLSTFQDSGSIPQPRSIPSSILPFRRPNMEGLTL
ncbi:hypothetical protein BGZ61DRAFT_589603 [Ilyonectria robusta]|uniref:uncharacterized protein n=1 Tax=Ilyonectria robusta TaxID=1079257 RepID=UPI001E8D7334|nr:uncharacterized protein BGZ61DRAFT_589603 [Ilyonectria robusta]KAH8686423.1 hypothetical protein BGZ61DRAFT_589603 [Ilyonectria robusta]